jgi:hypothetical protein
LFASHFQTKNVMIRTKIVRTDQFTESLLNPFGVSAATKDNPTYCKYVRKKGLRIPVRVLAHNLY